MLTFVIFPIFLISNIRNSFLQWAAGGRVLISIPQRDASWEGHFRDRQASREGTHTPTARRRIICKFLCMQLCSVAPKARPFFMKESLWWQSSHQLMQIPVGTKKGELLSCLLLYYCWRKEKKSIKGERGGENEGSNNSESLLPRLCLLLCLNDFSLSEVSHWAIFSISLIIEL